MLDVRKLQMLAGLERLGSVAAVAAELHLTAPGVSMQLGALERELGIVLTERRGRRLALTPAGTALAAHARDLMDRLSLVDMEVDALRRGAIGTYRLAAFPSAARTFVADLWRGLIRDDAGIGIGLQTLEPDAALAAVLSGGADLAIVHSYSNVARELPESMVSEHLVTEPVWVAISEDDPLVGDRISLADLADRDWITPTRDLTCFEMVDRACGLAGFRPRVVAESADFDVQLQLVDAGVGVCLVPELTVAAVPAGVRLVSPTTELRRHLALAYREPRRADVGLRRIIDDLQAIALTRSGSRPRSTIDAG
ncbi:LysR family transcriptional regulator [Nocardioides insulae]|uniref:LysR family transcriptional regulator n=1 Tax=Nocardioides insulae TaxID=394734 RepID=UPI000405C53B|nr:LysR family transcriptional regulator [Nocardioides insulae]